MKLILVVLSLLTVGAFALNPNPRINTTVTETAFTVTTTNQQILAANSHRGYLLIQNRGTDFCIVKFGSSIATNEGILITAGGYYEPNTNPTASINMLCNSGSQAITVVEGNY